MDVLDNLTYHDRMTSPGFQVVPAFFKVEVPVLCVKVCMALVYALDWSGKVAYSLL